MVGAEGSVPIPDGSGGSQLHSLPIFPEAQTPPPGRLRRGLAWPGTSQPTFQVLAVLAYPCGRARTPGASPPVTLAWTSSPFRYLSRAKATSGG